MNASQRAHTAYGQASATSKSASQVEYQAFARITKSLSNAVKSEEEAKALTFPKLAAALHENSRLWTIIAGDVAHESNALPQDLRAQLFYLAEFTLDHTGKVLRGEADATPLVEINTAVMRGLRQQQEAAQCPA